MTKPDEKINKLQLLKEKVKRCKKPDDLARRLNSYLVESESSVDLAHVLHSLQENSQDCKQLSACHEIVVKFTNKAVRTNNAFEWLQAINNLLEQYQRLREIIPANLYISKYHCLQHFSLFDSEAGDCLHIALALSKNNLEKIKAYYLLAMHYENISEYENMKSVLLQCESVCKRISSSETYLARTWVLLAHYYFYKAKLDKAIKYLNQAKDQLEIFCKNQEDVWQFSALGNCLHYIGRIYFEKYDFINAAIFYIKAETIFEETAKQNSLTPEIGATAFYHLRLGQVLEACQLNESAKYHYDKSQKIFADMGSGLLSSVHINLALANLVDDEFNSSNHSRKQSFQKEEKQIKDAAEQALKIGYHRGYLMSLVQLLGLYVKNRKIYRLANIILKIFLSKELSNLGGFIYLLNYIYTKLFNKTRFYLCKNLRSAKILHACPCSDPKCKYP